MIKDLDFIRKTLEGYLDLDSYLVEKYGSVSIKNNPDIEENEGLKIITINGNKYYFKPCSKEESVKEILCSSMLDYVGIDHAVYNLCALNGEYGIISKNFKDINYDYITGDELIYEYYNNNANTSQEKFDFDKHNNLIDIWNLLEIRYNYYPNKEAIVRNIMRGINEKFIFDIITCQWDGASYNWMIAENSTYAKFAPIYDNQKMLDGLDYDSLKNKNIKVENFDSSRENYDNLEELRKYLNYSSEEFRNIFLNMFKSLNPNNVKWIIISIENELGIKFEHKIKESIISRYNYNYQNIQRVLEEELIKKR